MTYSTIGILAAVVHVIINLDYFRRQDKAHESAAHRIYRLFLWSVLAFYITDALWGILHEHRLAFPTYADTVLYFIIMALSVLLWTRYVVAYLERENAYGRIMIRLGWVIFDFTVLAVVINAFYPILFSLDEGGEYHAGVARYLVLLIQILMCLMSALYTLITSAKGGAARRRHLSIGLAGSAMSLLFMAQLFYPLLPLYSAGLLLGSCLMHTFVQEDEKAERRRELEELLSREREQQQALGSARKMAYTDALTGVKNKHAYTEKEQQMDQRIEGGDIREFAVVFFDLNGLKHVNDTLGHKMGDLYIGSACRLICDVFKHSPVFRIGGDEFVAVMEGQDFADREHLMEVFNRQIEENMKQGLVVVSAGLSEFVPELDKSIRTVFKRAEEKMYVRKKQLKEQGAIMR